MSCSVPKLTTWIISGYSHNKAYMRHNPFTVLAVILNDKPQRLCDGGLRLGLG